MCWRAGLVVLNSPRFFLSVKLLISSSYLNEILALRVISAVHFFSFITLSMFCHSLLAWRVFIERSTVILMGIPLCGICYFSLLLLIFALCVWSLLIWLMCVLRCFTLGLSCLGLSGFLGLGWLFPSPFGGSFLLLYPQVFSHALSFCLLFLGHL